MPKVCVPLYVPQFWKNVKQIVRPTSSRQTAALLAESTLAVHSPEKVGWGKRDCWERYGRIVKYVEALIMAGVLLR
jgi:hypothetical protein